MGSIKRRIGVAGMAVVLLGIGLPAGAEGPAAPLSRDEPIYIESDSLKIDDVKGLSTYQGSVVFRQGAATLTADTLVIQTRNRSDVETIVAKGTPARFEQRSPEPDKSASGEALRIEYVAPKSLVILDGQARFRQGENQFSGNRIEYEAEKKIVRAGKSVSPNGEGGRVNIVIQPRRTTNSPDRDAVKP